MSAANSLVDKACRLREQALRGYAWTVPWTVGGMALGSATSHREAGATLVAVGLAKGGKAAVDAVRSFHAEWRADKFDRQNT